ncbi:MAG: hypothetical protein JWN03_1772 [Nocardia sp.]|nr:hypothetical protein [Nocardia sp.]
MVRRIVAVLVLATIVGAAGCRQPEPRGTVTDRWAPTGGVNVLPTLVIRQADGTKARIGVGWGTWRRCHKRDRYPHCAHTTTTGLGR